MSRAVLVTTVSVTLISKALSHCNCSVLSAFLALQLKTTKGVFPAIFLRFFCPKLYLHLDHVLMHTKVVPCACAAFLALQLHKTACVFAQFSSIVPPKAFPSCGLCFNAYKGNGMHLMFLIRSEKLHCMRLYLCERDLRVVSLMDSLISITYVTILYLDHTVIIYLSLSLALTSI